MGKYEVSDISRHPPGAELIILERDECLQNRSWDHFVAPAWFGYDAVARRYEQRFGQVDWEAFSPRVDTTRRGRLPHPIRAYVQAFCVIIEEGLEQVTQVWRYLSEHPPLVWLLGFRLQPDSDSPYGFEVVKSLPTARHLRRVFASLPHECLRGLLAQSVRQAVQHIPTFGQTVSLDVQHIYAHVAQNNPHQFMGQRFDPQRQPKGDPDCRLGWKPMPLKSRAKGVVVGLWHRHRHESNAQRRCPGGSRIHPTL